MSNNDNLKLALKGERTYFIAEIGTNHSCSIEQAFDMIGACADAGIDCVKFQSWKVDQFQNPLEQDEDGRWIKASAGYELLSRYQLPDDWHQPLADRCHELGVDFLSAAFDPERAQFLKEIGVSAIKIASGDLTYIDLLDKISTLGLPVILSTGMGTLDEVQQAVEKLGGASDQLAILHCVGNYPPEPSDANLRAINTLKDTFGTAVGWSDHYRENCYSIASVAMGGSFVEKHVTLSRDNPDPDAPFALIPQEFGELIKNVRILEEAMGDGNKDCAPGETQGRIFGRRSLYSSKDLPAGHEIVRSDINVVRPALGDFFANEVDLLVGKKTKTSIKANHPFCKSSVSE